MKFGQIITCSRCVMDTTDSAITFDKRGVCDHCRGFDLSVSKKWNNDGRERHRLGEIVDSVRRSGNGRDFDCILGLSGGLDSSYMLHLLVTEFNLRPLVFHVDGGWNSSLAVSNIQLMVEKLNLDLFTEVIDWEDMRDLQLAFFKSGIAQIDIPQDHAFISTLYKFADKYGIKYIMNGGNLATECVRNPLEWLYYGTDMRLINDIRRRFCKRPLDNYPFSSVFFHKLYLRYIKGVHVLKPLNYLHYTKKIAIETLTKEYGWTTYPQKHFESRFTKFFEGYWLPSRFGYDTRKVQFSSLILTEQMTRDEALDALKRPAYKNEDIEADLAYISRKLGVTIDELRFYHSMPLKSYRDYCNQEMGFNIGAKLLRVIGVENSIKR